MKIRTQLHVSMGIVVILVLAVGWTVLSTSRAVNNAIARSNAAAEIVTGKTQQRFLLMEYLLTHEVRPKEQWLRKQKSVTELISTYAENNESAQKTLRHVLQLHQLQLDIFSKLTHAYETQDQNTENLTPLPEYEAQLQREMVQITSDMVSDMSQLARVTEKELSTTENLAAAAVMSLVVILGITVTSGMLLVYRNVLKPITKLQQGMTIIGAGNLDFRTNIVSKDEIGELSGAFDQMAEHLQSSRDALKKESLRLDAANKELEAFSYSVSHDLRTPLRAIDGYSHMLLKKYDEQLDNEGKRLLHVVRDSTARMGQLIDDILGFSRAGRLELKCTNIDMDSLVKDVWKEVSAGATDREIRLNIGRLPPGCGDPSMLRQVWVNLLSNALKFTRPRPMASIEVSGKIDGQECQYHIKDNGVGFNPKYVDKLFGVFQRLHGIDEFEGTGIGLAIVKRVVVRHGGRIWAEGCVDAGAEIHFTLPVKET